LVHEHIYLAPWSVLVQEEHFQGFLFPSFVLGGH